MRWRMLVFLAWLRLRTARRLALGLLPLAMLAAAATAINGRQEYTLTIVVAPPYLAEGVEIYQGCCTIVASQSGDKRTFTFTLRQGDYHIAAMLDADGEAPPQPIQPLTVHLDHDQTTTLHGG